MWVDQIKDDLCLWHHHVNYHDKKNVGAHQVGGRNTETTDIKRYLLDIMLVVLIETRKKRMWINDCKYKTNTEWVDVYVLILHHQHRNHCHNEHTIWRLKRIDDVQGFAHSNR